MIGSLQSEVCPFFSTSLEKEVWLRRKIIIIHVLDDKEVQALDQRTEHFNASGAWPTAWAEHATSAIPFSAFFST